MNNSFLSGLLKLSQLLLWSWGLYHWAGAGTERGWRGEKSVKRGKTSASKWSPEPTDSRCERCSDAFNTSSAEAMATWSADIISCFPFQHEKGGEPTPTHSRLSSALAKHNSVWILHVFFPLLLLTLTKSFTINMFIHLKAGLVLWAPIQMLPHP